MASCLRSTSYPLPSYFQYQNVCRFYVAPRSLYFYNILAPCLQLIAALTQVQKRLTVDSLTPSARMPSSELIRPALVGWQVTRSCSTNVFTLTSMCYRCKLATHLELRAVLVIVSCQPLKWARVAVAAEARRFHVTGCLALLSEHRCSAHRAGALRTCTQNPRANDSAEQADTFRHIFPFSRSCHIIVQP